MAAVGDTILDIKLLLDTGRVKVYKPIAANDIFLECEDNLLETATSLIS